MVQSVDLRVSDLKTSFDFYKEMLGLKGIESDGKISFLSANGKLPYLIKLTEDKEAPPRIKGTTGLYHIAFLFPNRKELARVFKRLFDNKIKFQGFSDHLVSEAIYLSDPDGNGIELYADKPKEEWVWKMGEVQMDSLPLDLSLITRELDDPEVWNGIHPGTIIGHIHLNVSDLFKAEKFYNDILGMDVTNFSYPGAKFFSVGKYHHHVGTNIWSTKNQIPKQQNSLGMTGFTIKTPDKDFAKLVEKNAASAGLLDVSNGNFTVKDFDGNKIMIVQE